MALVTAALLGIEKNIPRSKRKLQKHLRSAGLAYVSRTGKLIPAKRVADELCQCPQKCEDRVPKDVRERLFQHFYGLGDPDRQNRFLREHMDVRAKLNIPEMTSSGRSPRRITCKYLVPLLPSSDTVEVCQKAFVSAFVITTKRVRLQREKLISSMGLNSYSHTRNSSGATSFGAAISSPTMNGSPKLLAATTCARSPSESNGAAPDSPETASVVVPPECDVAATPRSDDSIAASFLEAVHVVERRGAGRSTRTHSSHKRLIDNPLIPVGLLLPEGVTIAPVTASPDHDRDIAIVNNFFHNQLWKPEYIGTYS